MTAPIINDFTSPYGALTAVGRGSVVYADVMQDAASGPITSWSATLRSGPPSNHFDAATPAAMTPARTPYITDDGRAAQLSGVTYVWDVMATGPGGFDTAVLTHTAYANAAMFGSALGTDNFLGAILYTDSPSDFCAKNGSAPKKILLATGAVRGATGIGIAGSFDFPAEVRIEHADPARPAPLSGISIGSGGSHFTIEDLTFDGPFSGGTGRVDLTACTNVRVRNNTFGIGISSFRAASAGVGLLGACDNVLIEGNTYEHQFRGVDAAGGTNITIRDEWYNHCHGQGIYIGNDVDGIDISDLVISNPYRTQLPTVDTSNHLDGIQLADAVSGAIAQNVKIDRVAVIMGNANSGISVFRPGNPGASAYTENLQISRFIGTTWAKYGFEVGGFSGASSLTKAIITKCNTGDDSTAPVGAKMNEFGDDSAILAFLPNTAANVAGTFDLREVYVSNTIETNGYSAPAVNEVADVHRYLKAGMTGFVVGDPQAYLEAISDPTYETYDKAGFLSLAWTAFARTDGKGPVNAAGDGWNDTPTADSTAVTADSNLFTADQTS